MNILSTFNWRYVAKIGLIAGIVIVYTGMMGMIATFNEREVIREFVTLGQLLLILPPIVASYLVTRRLREENTPFAITLVCGIVVGFLAAIPSIVLILINQASEDSLNNILENVNRDWLEVITFDNRGEPLKGILLLSLTLSIAGLAGTILQFIPEKFRRPIIYGVGITLGIGAFGKTVGLILKEHLSDDFLDQILRRETLLQTPALIILLVITGLGLAWAFLGDSLVKYYESFPAHIKRALRLSVYAFCIGILLLLPLLIGRALSEIMVTVGLYVLMGLGLNIAIGLAGLLDLGYVTNYAVGAYVLAVITSTSPLGIGNGSISFWTVIPLALLAAMLAGFIFAVPVLKMRGDYLAIATLGFGEIIGTLAISDWLKPYIGGAQGILFVPNPNFLGTDLKDPEQLYYIVLVACFATLFVSIRLNNSRIGRQWMAIREDEDVATAMGIDTARAKLLAFTISAATGGVAGAIFAAKVGSVFPNSFTVFVSINVLSLIIVGGLGSNLGIVIGALVLVGMPELLREFSDYRWLLYGVLLIAMMLYRPEGLLPSQIRARELQEKQKPGVASSD